MQEHVTAVSKRAGHAAVGVGLFAALLHGHVVAFRSESAQPSLVFLALLWGGSVLPYLMWGGGWLLGRQPVLALGSVLACLLVDLLIHHSVFVAPSASTAALGLVVGPILNLVAAAPAGSFVGWLVVKWRARRN